MLIFHFLYKIILTLSDYVFTENKKGMQCILPIKDDSIEEHYYLAEINSFDFFNDVIKYGKQFYKVLNDCITPIKMSYRPPQTFEESCINIVSEENIKLHLEELKPILSTTFNVAS